MKCAVYGRCSAHRPILLLSRMGLIHRNLRKLTGNEPPSVNAITWAMGQYAYLWDGCTTRKGIGLLVEAFKAADVPGARLVIVGPDEGMLATIQPMLDDRIIYTGYLGGSDRLAAFAAADILALPAVGEGLPMVVLEAMAAGLPVIVSPGCNLPEVAQYGAGIQADAALEPLRDALRQLLSDADKRTQMGTAAKALVAERFTWDAVAEQLEQVYVSADQSA